MAEALRKNNIIVFHHLFQVLTSNIYNDANSVDTFLNISKELFYNYPKKLNYNPFVTKIFLIFLHTYVKYVKTNKSLIMNTNKPLNDTSIVSCLLDCLTELYLSLKTFKIESQEQRECFYEKRECLIWSLNILVELCTQSTSREVQLDSQISQVDRNVRNFFKSLECLQQFNGSCEKKD